MSAKINHGLYRLFAAGRRTDRPTHQPHVGRERAEVRDGVGDVVYGTARCGEGGGGGGDKKSGTIEFFPRPHDRHESTRARYTCGLLNFGRFEFISSAAKPLSMRVGLAVLGPGVVITPGQEG